METHMDGPDMVWTHFGYSLDKGIHVDTATYLGNESNLVNNLFWTKAISIDSMKSINVYKLENVMNS